MPHPQKIVRDSNKNICRMEEREDIIRNTLVVLHWLVHTLLSHFMWGGRGGKREEKGGKKRREGGERGGRKGERGKGRERHNKQESLKCGFKINHTGMCQPARFSLSKQFIKTEKS